LGTIDVGQRNLPVAFTRDTHALREMNSNARVAQADTFSYFNNLIGIEPNPPLPSEWTADLELMHYFTAVTCETLPRGPNREGLWQQTFPRLALGYEFLMHQILALAALHLACLSSEASNKYSIKASQHQGQAIQGLRSIVSNVNNVNCHAIFATASLLSISAFATFARYATHHNQPPSVDNLLEAFSLIRGMNDILQSWEEIIKQGPLGRLLPTTPELTASPLLEKIGRDLSELVIPSNIDSQKQSMYRDEISNFTECIRVAQCNSVVPELRLVMMWPTIFSEELFGLLCKRNITAMLILKHYCQVLQSLESDHWYLDGWGSHVLQDIE
jgi:hypothetical protein